MRYHINPKTGNPGQCNATKSCPFGGPEVHYPSPANARKAYELSMGPAVKEAAKKESEEQLKAKEQQEQDNVVDSLVSQNVPATDFSTLASTPTVEDIRHGVEQACIQLSNTNSSTWGWKAVMGDVRRTEKNVATYERLRRIQVGKDPDLRAHALRAAQQRAKREAYGRAYEQNIPIDPALESHFEKIWAGEARGKSHQDILEEAEETQALRDGLLKGTVTPRTVVGSGLVNPSKAAKEYLDRRLGELSRALQTRGRSEQVNVSNALFSNRAS